MILATSTSSASSQPNGQRVLIGVIAKRAGLSIDTVRFYEKLHLLKSPPRTQSGYRLYGAEELRTLRFITGAQKLGFSLQEIRQLIDIQRCQGETCEKTSRLIDEKLRQVHEKIRQLREIECSLENALLKCSRKLKMSSRSSPDCPVLDELAS
jgi:MerR family transcriptional regulator, mercuric resistance operon regulatory protein